LENLVRILNVITNVNHFGYEREQEHEHDPNLVGLGINFLGKISINYYVEKYKTTWESRIQMNHNLICDIAEALSSF